MVEEESALRCRALVASHPRAYFTAMSEHEDRRSQLTGQLLVATPSMPDPRFERSVIYLCAHSAEGAMGLIVNKLVDRVRFADIARQVGIAEGEIRTDLPVHFGGPVETGRGCVLHSTDVIQEPTLVIDDGFALTATVDMLRVIARGEGPKQRLLALGYAGWAPGQLDAELQANGWLVVPADPELVFACPNDMKWTRALNKLGIDPSLLSTHMGHA